MSGRGDVHLLPIDADEPWLSWREERRVEDSDLSPDSIGLIHGQLVAAAPAANPTVVLKNLPFAMELTDLQVCVRVVCV